MGNSILLQTPSASTRGSVSTNTQKLKVVLSVLDSYRQTLVLPPLSTPLPIKTIFDILYDLLYEMGQVSKGKLLEGEIATYTGFNLSGEFHDYNIDWEKLTYFISFRAPFKNPNYSKYFNAIPIVQTFPRGDWYKRVNDIRLNIYKYNTTNPSNPYKFSNSTSYPTLRRLCKNGEPEVDNSTVILAATNGVTPLPVAKKYTTRGDYSSLGIVVPQGLLNTGEYYFGTNPASTDNSDDSEIPIEYFLTGHLIENPYNQANWLGIKSKPHVVNSNSGITIGLGLDLGTSGISNFNSEDPGGNEVTLNKLLLSLTTTWVNFTLAQKNIIYSVTIYGINNSVADEGYKRYGNASVKSIYDNNKSLFNLLNLQNTTNGGYKRTLVQFVNFWNRYYLKDNSSNLTTIEQRTGTKILISLKNKGCVALPNAIETFVVLAIGINKGLGGFNAKAVKFAIAINKHDLLLLSKAVTSAYSGGGDTNTRDKILDFMRTQEVKDYYENIHKNSQQDLYNI